MVATVALVAAVSCNKEFEQENIPAGGQTVVYTATVDQNDEPEAKAVLDGLVSKWSGNEYITLHDGSNGFYFHADAGETPVETIDFSYTPGEGDPAFTATDVMAVYPSGNYSADIANKKVSGVVVPEKQQLVDGTYPATAAVAVAYSSDTKILEFKNACALLKFKVAGDDVTRGCFYAEGDISGVFDVAYNGGKPTMTATEAKKWVDFHNDEQFLSEQATYYIAIAPGSVANFKMYLGRKEIKKYNSEYTFKRNVILDLGTLTYEAPEYAKTVYLKPGVWASDGAKFAAYFFSSTGNEGVMMEDTDSDGIYEATVPESDYSRVIFCRMDSASESFSWESTWNQTNNLDIPEASDNNLCYVITGYAEGEGAKSVGEWKSLEMATAVWTIAGAFNSWTAAPMVKSGDYFVAEDVIKLHSVENGFKILENGNWLGGSAVEVGVWTTLGGSDNIYVTGAASATKYDVYLNPASRKFVIVKAGEQMPEEGVTPPEETKTYYLRPMSSWEEKNGKYVAWAWKTDSEGSWYDLNDSDSDGIYELTVPISVDNAIFLCMKAGSATNWANELFRTSNLTLPSDDKNCYNTYTSQWVTVAEAKAYEPGAIYAQQGYVYLDASDWGYSDARYSIYFFGNGDTWVSMEKVEGTSSLYGANISDKMDTYTSLIFVRLNGATTENNFNNKWNQTGDLNMKNFKDGNNLFTVRGWDGYTDGWSTVTRLN